MQPRVEDALVAGLRAGEPGAFETLVRTHGPRLLRLARRFLPNEEDARDALQDALVAAYRSIGSFQSGSMLSTWLHRIVVNTALMKLRSQRRRPEADIEELLPRFVADGHQVEPAAPWPESADALLQRKETAEMVRESIAELPDAYRVVLELRDIEELDTAEVASILGITSNAVKIRLHRARQALRTILERRLQ
jgi:RNA polymerase sigma-70 factor (ECF subfamily)